MESWGYAKSYHTATRAPVQDILSFSLFSSLKMLCPLEFINIQDLSEAHLHVLLGGSGFRSNTTSAANTVIDPFLSSLVLNFVGFEADEFSKPMASSTEDSSAKNATSARLWKPRNCFILDHQEVD
ncbi:hypothetical protein Ancab_005165 [Ancistrocladus abbreviatus]